MQTLTNLAIRLGFARSEIFGSQPPHPNPYGYPTNPASIPIVPREEVKSGMAGKTVFDGGQITSGAGDRSFIARKEFGAPAFNKGDLFAFANADHDRPALVYEVLEVDRGRGADTLSVQDVGFLEDDSRITEADV